MRACAEAEVSCVLKEAPGEGLFVGGVTLPRALAELGFQRIGVQLSLLLPGQGVLGRALGLDQS